jgi:hypothetical protein
LRIGSVELERHGKFSIDRDAFQLDRGTSPVGLHRFDMGLRRRSVGLGSHPPLISLQSGAKLRLVWITIILACFTDPPDCRGHIQFQIEIICPVRSSKNI